MYPPPTPIVAPHYAWESWWFKQTKIYNTRGFFHSSYNFSGLPFFKKTFLCIYLCKNSTTIVTPPSGILIWTIVNLHYLRIILQLFWPNSFLKIFLYIYLCKNSTSIVVPPSRILIWSNLNLHCLWMLSHKF